MAAPRSAPDLQHPSARAPELLGLHHRGGRGGDVREGRRQGHRHLQLPRLRRVRPLRRGRREHGLKALFGLEFISVHGRGSAPTSRSTTRPTRAAPTSAARASPTRPTRAPTRCDFMDAAKRSNEARHTQMVDLMCRALFAAPGLDVDVTYDSIVGDRRERADVPAEWVVLQERHVALGFQEALFAAVPVRPAQRLPRSASTAQPAKAAPDDAIATQGELRSRLMKAGCPAFVEETPGPLQRRARLHPRPRRHRRLPHRRRRRRPHLRLRGPGRGPHRAPRQATTSTAPSSSPCATRPSASTATSRPGATPASSSLVGTEHNTHERIPVDPTCLGGVPLSEASRDIIWEGICVVAAHQHLKQQGQAGYVDATGTLNPSFPDAETRIRYFAEMGAELIYEATGTNR